MGPCSQLPDVLKAHGAAVDVHDIGNSDVGAEIHHPEDVVQRGLVAIVSVVVEDRGSSAGETLAVARRLGLRVDAADLGQAGIQVGILPAPPKQINKTMMQEKQWITGAVGNIEHHAADTTVTASVGRALDAVPSTLPRVFL